MKLTVSTVHSVYAVFLVMQCNYVLVTDSQNHHDDPFMYSLFINYNYYYNQEKSGH